MFGIPLIDVPSVATRYVRSARPHAPVIEDEKRRRRFGLAVRAIRR
jgi:hypothetical protein